MKFLPCRGFPKHRKRPEAVCFRAFHFRLENQRKQPKHGNRHNADNREQASAAAASSARGWWRSVSPAAVTEASAHARSSSSEIAGASRPAVSSARTAWAAMKSSWTWHIDSSFVFSLIMKTNFEKEMNRPSFA